MTLTIATKKKEYTMFATLRGFDCVLLCVIFCYSFSLLVGLPKDNMKRALQIGIAAVMAGTSTYILMINDEAYTHTHTGLIASPSLGLFSGLLDFFIHHFNVYASWIFV